MIHFNRLRQVLFLSCLLLVQHLVKAEVTITCTGIAGSYNSGSVNVGGAANDGNMNNLTSSANRGWAHFDLSSIPAGSTILAVTANFTTYTSTSSTVNNKLTGFVGNPATMGFAALYTTINSATTVNSSAWTANALQSKVLNAAGVAFIQANVGTNNANIGYVRASTNVYNIYGYGTATPPTLVITYNAACSGMPNPGNTLASTTLACAASTVNLSLQNQTFGSNVTYQWYANNVGVSGATNSIYSPTVNAATTYNCAVTCPSGGTTFSNPVSVTIRPVYECYCNSALGGLCNAHSISAVSIPGTTLNNTTTNCTTPYQQFPASGSTTATLTKGNSYGIKVTAASIGSPIQIGCWIDYNQNTTYEVSEFTLISTNAAPGAIVSATITIPATALSGLTGMRVRSDWNGYAQFAGGEACNFRDNGSTEDYVVNIVNSIPCSGLSNVAAPWSNRTSACSNDQVFLALYQNFTGTNISYQWYNGSTAIAGATNAFYNTNITATTAFHCNVTCSGTTVSSASTTITVIFTDCYCSSVPSNTSDEEIFQVTFNGVSTPTLYANANGCTNVAPGPGSLLNRYSNFKSLGNFTSIYKGATVSFEVRENECDGGTLFTNGVGIWIDYNHNGSFNDAGEAVFIEQTLSGATGPSPSGDKVVSGSFVVPVNALNGQTMMRVICAESTVGTALIPCLQYAYGETEDYLINIIQPGPCAGIPQVGNTVASATNVLAGTNVVLSLQHYPIGSGLMYQWYNSNGVIVGATNVTYSATINQSELFYCQVSCGANIGASAPITVYKSVGGNAGSYCIPTNDGSACITNVSFNQINHTTGGCTGGTANYNYYPTQIATVNKGSTYVFSMTTDVNAAITSVWIDFNRNSIFETDEWTQIYTNATSGNQAITIPTNAVSGNTLMRVRSRLTGNINAATDACIVMGSGETEDYVVVIGGDTCVYNNTHQYASACNNYTWAISGQTYHASGTYFKTTPQVLDQNCVDTTYLHLTLSNTISAATVNACNNYTWPINGITYSTNGYYTTTILNTNGCDSIVAIDLMIHMPNTGSSAVTSCNSYLWHGTTYTTSGIATKTFSNQHGCDSIHTLNITILNSPTRSETASAVNTYTWPESNITYTASGVYTKTVTSGGFCDSIIYLQLTIYQVGVTMSLQNVVQTAPNTFEYDVFLTNTGNTTLPLQSYTYGGNHAAGMRGTGTLTHTFVSRDPLLAAYPTVTAAYTATTNHFRMIMTNIASGSELNLTPGMSIRLATLRATNSVNFPSDFDPVLSLQTIAATGKTQCFVSCLLPPASTSTIINGIANTASAGTLQALNGVVNTPCLFLNPTSTFAATVTSINHVICHGQQTGSAQITLSNLGSAAPAGTIGTYKIDNGPTLNYSGNPITITNLSAGMHTVYVQTSYGCNDTKVFTVNQPSAPITSTGSVTACGQYIWNGNTYTLSGNYVHTYTNAQGCDSIRTLSITINPFPIVTASNVTRCIGSSISLVGAPTGGVFSLANPYSGPATNYTYTYTNSFGCTSTANAVVSVAGCNANLDIKLFYQGYYNGNNSMKPVLMNQDVTTDASIADSITVELRHTAPPYNVIATKKTLLQTNGHALVTFDYTPALNFIGNQYYFAIKHRSGLVTWSANPVTILPTTLYDFSNAANKAYGSNQIEIENNVWAMYSGDLNTDENIDLTDNPLLENDNNNFLFGYYATDLNGDGNVDLLDMLILEGNVYNFIYSLHP